MLGVERGTVKLVPYHKNWVIEFVKERSFLSDIFKEKALCIEHIGSTSIPGCMAKPLIDIAIKVKSLEDCSSNLDKLVTTNYIERINRLTGKQRVFAKQIDNIVTHHLHVIEEGEKDWELKLRFRNVLITNLILVEQYNQLKQSLSAKYANQRSVYTKYKSTFIEQVLRNDSRTKY